MKALTTVIIVLGVSAVLLSIAGAGLVFVRPENRGVVISAISPQGYRQAALESGLHWIVPFFERVVVYPISRQTYTMSIAPNEGEIQGDDSITARTSDGQEIFVDASVIAIDPAKVVKLHIDWQNRYSDELVRPLVRGIIRDVVSQYQVEQVVTSKRVEMTDSISADLQQRLEDNGLSLINFVLQYRFLT